LNREIEADDAARNSTDDEGDVLGLPLTMIHDITQEEIDSYTKMNVWIDNKAYQPQNHAEACKNLGIENPEQPHIQGFLPSIVLDRHQPTAINALTEFEDSCVGAGLNAEEVGLGKTVETIGLLLHRSNQRKAAISAGVPVAKALPTLIVLPQNLIQQWNTEIFQFTDVFNLVIYYGPPRKSGDEKIAYIPKSVNKGRLTRSHELFNGNEENANTIVITSYATYAARHGPNVQWKWLVEERKKKLKRDGQPATKKAAEDSLAQEGIRRNSVHEDCPHQLHGLFERVILDEGHTIRHQSDDVGFAVSNIGSRYRHILSGTPTFDNIEEFAGIMRFLQNPVLSQKKHLLEMGFTEHQLKNGSHDRPGKVTPLESALYFVDPYSLADDDVKMPLRYTSEAMEKYLFNKVYNDSKEFGTEEQGRRLAMVLQKIMLRRTQTSILDGIAIAKSLPRVQRSVFECEFTPTERAHYEYMMEDESSKLFKKSKNEKAVEWSTTAYRKWSLLASWLGFEYLLDYKAATLKSRRKNMDALSILRDVRKGQERLKIPKAGLLPITKDTKTTEIQKILEWHCAGSPKLRQLLPLLAEIVVLRKEKALIWVNNPAQAEWLEHVSVATALTLEEDL
jgi:SNF2 family DNA or RNA helicase